MNHPSSSASLAQNRSIEQDGPAIAVMDLNVCSSPLKRDSVPKPKRPRTAYNLFFRDQQEKINQMKIVYRNKSVNAAAIVSMRWRKLTPAEKSHYHKMAADDKLRYYNEKTAYHKYVEALESGHRLGPSNDEEGILVTHEDETMTSNFHCKTLGDCNNHFTPQKSPIADRQYHPIFVPPFSRESIEVLACQLDAKSIDFLIKALK